MRWTTGNRDQIEDRRGASGGTVAGVGLGGFIILLLLSWATGQNFLGLLDSGVPSDTTVGGPVQSTPQEERMVDFVDAVTRDAQTTWAQLLGNRYERTSVVLFRNTTPSACGGASAATGPFYCPGDRKIYLDLSFFDDLSQRLGAPGDFAKAYVITHELGHHVQNLLGLFRAREMSPASGAHSASVALELQADCFAGVWGNAASQSGRFAVGRVELDPGDAQEALRAAASIGDDRLQKMSTGVVMPERFTHGTSAQREEWFARGMQTGDPRRCDTSSTTF